MQAVSRLNKRALEKQEVKDYITAIARHYAKKGYKLQAARKMFEAQYYTSCVMAAEGSMKKAAKIANMSREHVNREVNSVVKPRGGIWDM